MTKYIGFDLDGTLATLDFDERIWLEEIPKLYSEKNNLDLKEAKDKLYATYFRSWMIEKIKDWTDIEYWFDRLGLEDWQKLIEDMKEEIYLYEDAVPALEKLKEDYKLIIITNSNRKFLDIKVESGGLDKYFDKIYSVNSDLGYSVKEPEVYTNICKELNIHPTKMVYIGDDYIRDYMIPSSVGINAYYLDRADTAGREEKKVTNLKEFVEKIKENE
ncbi:MAG: HAD family hydrolase [Candidatus Undinarchaeales archaeon]